MEGKGNKFLLKTDDNKVYLAEVEKKEDGGFKPEKKLNHDHKEASSNNYEAEGANGDYTDSYEEEIINEEEEADSDEGKAKEKPDTGAGKAKDKVKKLEKIKNKRLVTSWSDDDDDIMVTSSLAKRLAAARKKKKKKQRTGQDYSFVGEDSSEDILKNEKRKYLRVLS